MTLRRLLPEDAAIYREVRLEALATSPDAFASTVEMEREQPLERFSARLADSFVVGAFDGAELVGIAGFYVRAGPKHAHKGMLVGMFVRPQYRGTGLGGRLVEAIIGHARERVELLQLFVVSDNLPARRLYQRFGFVEYGVERHATKYRGQYHDDALMALDLTTIPDTGASALTEEQPA